MNNVTPSRNPKRRSPYQINRRFQGQLLILLTMGCAVVFLVLGLLIPDRDFSDTENRSLTQFPKPTVSNVLDGSFLEALGDYTADQFPARDFWISLNLKMNRFLGQKEANGVYLCDDGTLIQIPDTPNWEQTERNLAAAERFAGAYPDLRMVMTIVPNAATIDADKLPANAPVRDQLADLAQIRSKLENVTFCDVTDTLMEHKDEYLFYKTDHHWTSLAAKYAVYAMAEDLNIPIIAEDAYTVYPVSNTFEGTLSSKSGSHAALDSVEIYVPKASVDYYVTYPDGRDVSSLYHREALNQKDHYTLFFGGNYSRLDITTTADTGRCLLLFKDSYANCAVQFLFPYYDHITIIDPRYYYDNVDLVIKTESITDVLFLYNLDTFLNDTSLADVLLVEE